MEIGLVLGGGGARGSAHIGVIQALEARDLTPVAIAGCSMGAIVGAFCAAGFSAAEMQEIMSELTYQQLLSFGGMGGLIGGRKILTLLERHLPATFEELAHPLHVTTVDVQTGELVVLRSGPLAPALRASSAIPGIFSPVEHRGHFLVDGGLLNNLPVDVIRTMTLHPIVAVDVAAPPNRRLDFGKDKPTLSQRIEAMVSGEESLLDSLFRRALTVELFMKTFDVPQRVMTEMRLAMQPPDLLIRPRLDPQFGAEDFDRQGEAIEAGYRSAIAAIDEWLMSKGE
ncbi:MAG: patatin-like phospholipase family protein [Anaerolineales bacterium]|nr:patatin-like phospholipase family protein [Anaerolineales bacterium]